MPQGGVLCTLPVLLVLGLIRSSAAHFPWLPGYYPLETIFLAIALLAPWGERDREREQPTGARA